MRRSVLAFVVLALLAVSCSGPAKPKRYRPGEASPEQRVQVEQAVGHYLLDDPLKKPNPEAMEEFARRREQLSADPVTAYALAQFLSVEVLRSLRERGRMGDPLLQKPDIYEQKALVQLEAMGDAVMPLAVEGLLKVSARSTGAGFDRILGMLLVEKVGHDAIPFLEPLLISTVIAERRLGLMALSRAAGLDRTEPLFARALSDQDFTVRAAAIEALGADADNSARIRAVLEGDADPFVRRKAAEVLGQHAGVENARALVEYLGRAQADRDHRGVEVAQEALQALAGSRGVRSLPAWRVWLQGYRG